MPAVNVVFEEESEFPSSLIEELGRSRILRSLYFNGLRNQRDNSHRSILGYWHNLSICTEEDETPVATEYPEPFKDKKKKKKTSMLQRALSERTRSRRLTYQAEEARSCLAPQRFPHRTNTSEGKQEYQHLPNQPADFPPVPMVSIFIYLPTPAQPIQWV
ncbi:hypothetical protein AVEN_170904-1 [Araneus ventricosus]|uniref:Uncharacterized protein n=1 Tax=Araneus ventricosus TaxID=182803 RepID=A0A4Y2UL29_ARAVE|nr:hypothetical protein AVEN_170904-1 [Araneus ventricosus]